MEKIEAGIVLDGGEVKSVRQNQVNLKDSFCFITGGELFIKNMHIAVYDKAGAFNLKDAKRDRKLLVKKDELIKIGAKIYQRTICTVGFGDVLYLQITCHGDLQQPEDLVA